MEINPQRCVISLADNLVPRAFPLRESDEVAGQPETQEFSENYFLNNFVLKGAIEPQVVLIVLCCILFRLLITSLLVKFVYGSKLVYHIVENQE